jgi:hypothetical protein
MTKPAYRTVVRSISAADKIKSVLPPKRLLKDSFFKYADARGIKRMQRVRKVEAEVRSADAIVRTMRGYAQVLHLSAIEN